MQLQEENDPYYKLPIEIIGGCSCKNVCGTCSCKRGETSVNRKRLCTPISCRSCKCIRDHTDLSEMEEEESEDSMDEEEESSTDEGEIISLIPYDPYAGVDYSSEDEM